MRSASCNWRSRGRVTWLHCRHLLPDSEVRNGEILSPISGPKRLVGGSTRALRSLHHCLSARTAFRADIGSLPFRAQRSIRRPVIQAGNSIPEWPIIGILYPRDQCGRSGKKLRRSVAHLPLPARTSCKEQGSEQSCGCNSQLWISLTRGSRGLYLSPLDSVERMTSWAIHAFARRMRTYSALLSQRRTVFNLLKDTIEDKYEHRLGTDYHLL